MTENKFTKFIIKRRTSNNSWDVRSLVTQAKLTKDIQYNAGEFDFTLNEVNDNFAVHNGDIVIAEWDGVPVFYGYVFIWELERGRQYKITAYDSLRYFKSSDSHVFPVSTLEQRFKTICNILKLKHKIIAHTSHKLKSELCDEKTYFAMLQGFIQQQQRATGHAFFIDDNFGVVELRKCPFNNLNMIIGDESLVTDYTFKRSIDQSANVVRLVKNSNAKGHKSVKTVSANGGNINEWGKLIYTKAVTSKSNDAQMHKAAQDLLRQKNRQANEMKLTCIGNTELQPGNTVLVKIQDLADIGIGTKRFLIKKATHNFSSEYTVDLEMNV